MAAQITYDVVFTDPIDFTDRIVQGTKIIDVPTILNQMVEEDRAYFILNMQTNFENMVPPIETYFEERILETNAALKLEILSEVAFDNELTYDITVNYAVEAQLSLDSNLLQGKTITEIITQAGNELLPTAEVDNALHLEGQTIAEILGLVPAIKVDASINSDTLGGQSKEQIKSDISNDILGSLTNASTLEGSSLAEVIALVEGKVTTLWKASDSLLFNGLTQAEWENKIVTTESDQAANSLLLGGKSLGTIEGERAAALQIATDEYLVDYDVSVTSKIQSTVATLAADAIKFDGDTRATWLATIAATEITLAANSTEFDGRNTSEWETRISQLVESNTTLSAAIRTEVETAWKAFDSLTADSALIADDLIQATKDAIRDTTSTWILAGDAGSINADSLETKTVQDILDMANISAGNDIISAGSRGLIHPESDFVNPWNVVDLTTYYSVSQGTIIRDRLFDFIFSSYQPSVGDESTLQPIIFDPETIDIWSRVNKTYNTDGTLDQAEYYVQQDPDLNGVNGPNLLPFDYNISASGPNPITLFATDYDSDGTMMVYGESTIGDSVTITYRDASQVSGVVDGDGRFAIQSLNDVSSYKWPTKIDALVEDKIVQTNYTYSNGLLSKKEYTVYKDELPSSGVVYEIVFNDSWNATAFSTEILLTQDIQNPTSVNDNVRTTYTEFNGNRIKEVFTTSYTIDSSMFGPNIGVERTLSGFSTPPTAGDTIITTYSITNYEISDITSVSIVESNANYTVSGAPVATITAGTTNTSISSSYTLTSTDLENGDLESTNTTLTATDSSSDPISRNETSFNTEWLMTQTLKKYALVSNINAEIAQAVIN